MVVEIFVSFPWSWSKEVAKKSIPNMAREEGMNNPQIHCQYLFF